MRTDPAAYLRKSARIMSPPVSRQMSAANLRAGAGQDREEPRFWLTTSREASKTEALLKRLSIPGRFVQRANNPEIPDVQVRWFNTFWIPGSRRMAAPPRNDTSCQRSPAVHHILPRYAGGFKIRRAECSGPRPSAGLPRWVNPFLSQSGSSSLFSA